MGSVFSYTNEEISFSIVPGKRVIESLSPVLTLL